MRQRLISPESDYAEQLRDPIVKSAGFTPSERHLAKLAEQTFLQMWSYPSPFRDQLPPGITDGKEVCDLLVVCDPHVIIFSEKTISWSDTTVDVAWPRWSKKAIKDAIKQLDGAERWMRQHPERLFLDSACLKPLPLALPPLERRQVHRVVVANGAAKACRDYFKGGSGSFFVDTTVKGNSHWSTPSKPFTIGDVQPDGNFVHVLDEAALDIVMGEFDTIVDFVSYLAKRASFIRSGHLELAAGEEELVAYYSTHMNDLEEHDFTHPEGLEWTEGDTLALPPGIYDDFVSSSQYQARAEANKPSYFWDHLIETFSTHLLGGTSIVLPEFEFELTKSELAVRAMALTNRFVRRNLGTACIGALEEGRTKEVFFRAIISPAGAIKNETGFFILTLKYQPHMRARGYETYRRFRTSYLEVYSEALLLAHPHLKRIIGIAMEPPGQGAGASEDLSYMEQQVWTDERRAQVYANCERYGIMSNLRMSKPKDTEFPTGNKRSVSPLYKGSNRKARRAAAAMARKLP